MTTTPRQFLLFLVLSAIFLQITATTFASLGIVLPSMIKELDWTWTQAGLGYTFLALFTGVFSPIAAGSLKHLGARGNYALGGSLMMMGFLALSKTNGLFLYFMATSLLGAGFALLANVPSVFVIGQIASEKWRNRLIGIYLAAGGAGGVAGPLIANGLIGVNYSWRLYWLLSLGTIALLSLCVVILLGRSVRTQESEPASQNVPTDQADRDNIDTTQSAPVWTLAQARKTCSFYMIGAALMVAYFCSVTINTWGFAHMQNLGLSAGFASAMLSLHAASNAAARALGGFASTFIKPRHLLVTGLIAEVIGMIALTVASSPMAGIIFGLFEGFAFGMILFATTALQIEYFGIKHSPAILGAMNLFATIAMIGPVLTGYVGDTIGSFAPMFIVFAVWGGNGQCGNDIHQKPKSRNAQIGILPLPIA